MSAEDRARATQLPAARPGVVAIGDSITGGRGAPILGVDCRPWAHWLADALGVPFHGLAQDGARVAAIAARQLPRARAGYALAAVYVGVNDVRRPDFSPAAFGAGLERILAHASAHAERTVVCTIPFDLGRPRAGLKVAAADAIIRRLAEEHGAAVAGLEDLRGWRLMLPDAVHPTALGQLEIADRAARALGLAAPSAAVPVDRGPRALARYALTGRAPAVAWDRRRRVVEAARRRSG